MAHKRSTLIPDLIDVFASQVIRSFYVSSCSYRSKQQVLHVAIHSRQAPWKCPCKGGAKSPAMDQRGTMCGWGIGASLENCFENLRNMMNHSENL